MPPCFKEPVPRGPDRGPVVLGWRLISSTLPDCLVFFQEKSTKNLAGCKKRSLELILCSLSLPGSLGAVPAGALEALGPRRVPQGGSVSFPASWPCALDGRVQSCWHWGKSVISVWPSEACSRESLSAFVRDPLEVWKASRGQFEDRAKHRRAASFLHRGNSRGG